jgi:hypothetical protein
MDPLLLARVMVLTYLGTAAGHGPVRASCQMDYIRVASLPPHRLLYQAATLHSTQLPQSLNKLITLPQASQDIERNQHEPQHNSAFAQGTCILLLNSSLSSVADLVYTHSATINTNKYLDPPLLFVLLTLYSDFGSHHELLSLSQYLDTDVFASSSTQELAT